MPSSQDDLTSTQRQLNEARANLKLIRERISEYILGVDVPLQLINSAQQTAQVVSEHWRAPDADDVAAVLGPDFFTRGTVYFDGVWSQTTHTDQRTLLQVMAQRDDKWPLSELATTTRLTPEALRAALRWAEHHDILQKTSEEAWRIHVPLMRRWIHEKN